jgi:hypothetical protein
LEGCNFLAWLQKGSALTNPDNLPFPLPAEIEEEVNGQLNESEKKTVIQCQNKVDGLKKR